MTWTAPTTSGSGYSDAPPPGTAIVRPLRHVQAVRERHMLRFATPADAAASRSVRAWAWALGENSLSPVTNQQTSAPPTRQQIQAEITAADDRRLTGGREGRADAAATILRWLIGEDDHVPIRCDNPGELVGGFGDIVRSRQQILGIMEKAFESRQIAASLAHLTSGEEGGRHEAQQHADCYDGMIATLGWVLGDRNSPVTHPSRPAFTSKDIKAERLHAEDVIQQARLSRACDQVPSPSFCEGVRRVLSWLLGGPTEVITHAATHDSRRSRPPVPRL